MTTSDRSKLLYIYLFNPLLDALHEMVCVSVFLTVVSPQGGATLANVSVRCDSQRSADNEEFSTFFHTFLHYTPYTIHYQGTILKRTTPYTLTVNNLIYWIKLKLNIPLIQNNFILFMFAILCINFTFFFPDNLFIVN